MELSRSLMQAQHAAQTTSMERFPWFSHLSNDVIFLQENNSMHHFYHQVERMLL